MCGISPDGCGAICQVGSGCRTECTPTCNQTKVCRVSSDGCGDTCQLGSGCQNGLAAGQSLQRGADCIYSVGGRARLCHQSDGNVVVYDSNDDFTWSTFTGGRSTSNLTMQSDGNLVLHDQGEYLWSSETGGQDFNEFVAVIQDDCNFVIYHPNGNSPWRSGQLCND